MASHHRVAAQVIAAALGLDILLGALYSLVTPGLPLWHGWYCALANAVTVGGDVAPVNTAGYLLQAVECILVVPLFGASFSFFTSGLTAGSVADAEERIKDHVNGAFRRHLGRPDLADKPEQDGGNP
jgi:hypothetical protein